jgi:hypothetical protein
MMTKSICLLLFVLPLACSKQAAPNTTGGGNTSTDVAPPAGISIRPKARRPVLVGGVQQLVGDAPGAAITWRSANPNVATVSADGLVRGITEGDTTLSATATYPNGTIRTASVGVFVRPQPPVQPIASRRHGRR